MDRLFWHIVVGILGVFLGVRFVSGVSLELMPGESSFLGFEFTAAWQIFVLVGGVLGVVNFFIKPIVRIVTLPLRILTFGLFSLVINMLMIWLVDLLFLEFVVEGVVALFWLTLIIWALSFFFGLYSSRKGVLEE
jgi:putative membrane protein